MKSGRSTTIFIASTNVHIALFPLVSRVNRSHGWTFVFVFVSVVFNVGSHCYWFDFGTSGGSDRWFRRKWGIGSDIDIDILV